MAYLLGQPSEVLHNIFQNVEPTDLASLSQTCRSMHTFIQRDDLLWKIQYLQQFDPPKLLDAPAVWRSRLRKLVEAQKLLESKPIETKNEDVEKVAINAIELMLESTSAPNTNIQFLAHHFSSSVNISKYICRSSLFKNSRHVTDGPASTEALRQLSAKLHVFYGGDVEPTASDFDYLLARPVHPVARSRVYDLRRYTEGSLWGPFLDDGSQAADWEKVQAVMVDLCFNLREYSKSPRSISTLSADPSKPGHLWGKPFEGLAPHSYKSKPLDGEITPSIHPELDARDPYGVRGTWTRIVCFLDYNDLYTFNFESDPIPRDQEREPIDTREAFRLIRVQIQVAKIEAPGEDDDPSMPVVHFTGRSKSTYMPWDQNANSKIRGIVRTTKSGAIRWTTFSIFHGSERWRSEGIQIGGIRSARGILGNWFDTDYDIHGPAGPTAFWKTSDDIVEDKQGSGTVGMSNLELQEIINLVFEQQ